MGCYIAALDVQTQKAANYAANTSDELYMDALRPQGLPLAMPRCVKMSSTH